jgi:hypothetical protein
MNGLKRNKPKKILNDLKTRTITSDNDGFFPTIKYQ